MHELSRDYIKFEIKLLGNLEDEFYKTQDERLRQLILHNRIVLKNYWAKNYRMLEKQNES